MSYKKAPAIKKGSHHPFQEKGDISSTFEKIASTIPCRHFQLERLDHSRRNGKK